MTTVSMSASAITTAAVADRPGSTPALLRFSGFCAVAAGLIYAGIQPFHPADALASVTTIEWATIIALKLAMCLLFLVGLAGIHLSQARESGRLGLVGFGLFALSWWLQASFVFAELLILPPLAGVSPEFVTSFLGIFNGRPGGMDVDGLASAYGVVGLLYLVGGIVFGIATLRARVLPRLPSAVLAIAALATPAAALLPHELQRFAAVPVGLAIAWLGLALWLQFGNRRAR